MHHARRVHCTPPSQSSTQPVGCRTESTAPSASSRCMSRQSKKLSAVAESALLLLASAVLGVLRDLHQHSSHHRSTSVSREAEALTGGSELRQSDDHANSRSCSAY